MVAAPQACGASVQNKTEMFVFAQAASPVMVPASEQQKLLPGMCKCKEPILVDIINKPKPIAASVPQSPSCKSPSSSVDVDVSD